MGEAKRRKAVAIAAGLPWPPKSRAITVMQRPLMQTTPIEPLSDRLMRHCRSISDAQPVFLRYTDLGQGFGSGQCHANVLHCVRVHGGKRINGWLIWESAPFDDAEFHCVWENPEGELLDVTPRKDGEERILFLPDPATRLGRGPNGGIMQPVNRTSLPEARYLVAMQAWDTPFAEIILNAETRRYMSDLGFDDPFVVCDDC